MASLGPKYDVTRSGYQLPSIDPGNTDRNVNPVSSSSIGNVYAIRPGQSIPIATETSKPRLLTISNVGALPVALGDTQRTFPYGLRLCAGDVLDVLTNNTLYACAPSKIEVYTTTLVEPVGYLSVSDGGK